MPNVLTVRGLKKSYGQRKRPSSESISMSGPEEVFALIGPNGAGRDGEPSAS
ncbi:MAG: hypothetical protein MZU79_04700 [Anaerotruncus sp.]|nr:hypothetical protein [Anaerotruncus sp.]